MEQREIPLGFGMALAQNAQALERFSKLSAAEQTEVIKRASGVSSKAEMQALISNLPTFS